MKRRVAYITFADVIFILILSVSGLLDGVLSELFYYLGFVIPTAFLILLAKKEEGSVEFLSLKPSLRDVGVLLPTVAPTLALVFLISFITSLLLSLIKEPVATELTDSVALDLLIYALLPAFLEEMLFRYATLPLLVSYSKRWAVIITALLFSFSHCSLYQIPYAFAAGLIFATLDLMLGSVWPSFILHFVNNAASIAWIRISGNTTASIIYMALVLSLAAVSLVFIFAQRKSYRKALTEVFSGGEVYKPSHEPILFLAVTLIIAVTAL